MTLKTARRSWWVRGHWLVVPLVVFGLTEGAVRGTFDRVPRWYAAAQQAAARGHVDVVFVGTSRVREAVHVATFEQEVFTLSGHCVRALNLGRGYSTEAEHYLGVRNLFASYPAALHGATVFVEAFGGLPAMARWAGPWVQTQQPWMVVDLLRWKDLLPFWRSSGLSIGEKLHLTLRLSVRSLSSTFNRRERVREQLLARGIPWLVSLANGRILSNPFGEVSAGPELAGPDLDIRIDAASSQLARKLAVQVTDELLAQQYPMRGWDTTIQKDLIELVRRHGGGVVFFDVPLSSPFARLFSTPLRREDIRLFREQARLWGTPMLRPEIAFDDGDFSDLWHVGPPLAVAFSVGLARTWVDVVRTTRQRPAGTEEERDCSDRSR